MLIKNLETLIEITSRLKEEGKKVSFTSGCFDILHPGHIKVLEEAQKLGDVLLVGVNGDKSPYWEYKKGSSINNETYRAKILEAIKYVDYIYFFQDLTPLETIQAIMPDVIVKGGDYGPKNYAEDKIYDVTENMKELIKQGKDKISKERIYIVGSREVISNGGKVIVVPIKKGYSTSQIVKKIKDYE